MKSNTSSRITAIAALSVALLAGSCKEDPVRLTGDRPTVQLISPIDGATKIGTDQPVTVTFTQPMMSESFTNGALTLRGPGYINDQPVSDMLIPGTLIYNDVNRELTFLPTISLDSNALYTSTVSSSVRNINGKTMESNFTWTFKTGPTRSPVVIIAEPFNGEQDVYVNQTVSATFSKPMDPATLSSFTFIVRHGSTVVPGDVSYTSSKVSFIRLHDFTMNTTYTATLSASVSDLRGMTIPNEYVWTFTTGSW